MAGESAETRASNQYWVLDNHANKGYKFAVTVILGFPKISERYGLPFDFDFELTFSFTIKNNVWRLDAMAIDPVLDVDTRNFWYRQYMKALDGLTNNQPAVDLAGIQLVEFTRQAQQSTNIVAASAVSSSSSSSSFAVAVQGLGGASVGGSSTAGLASAAGKIASVPSTVRAWATFEVSPLRIILPNSDVNNPAQTFRGGFHRSSIAKDRRAYVPGIKYITGVGIHGSTAITSFFLRGTMTPEIYFPYCTDACLKSLAYSGAGGGG